MPAAVDSRDNVHMRSGMSMACHSQSVFCSTSKGQRVQISDRAALQAEQMPRAAINRWGWSGAGRNLETKAPKLKELCRFADRLSPMVGGRSESGYYSTRARIRKQLEKESIAS